MPFSICPIKNGYGTDFETDSIASATVPVNCHFCAMNSKLLRGLDRSPDIVTLMLVYYGSGFLEILIDRQNNLT